MSRAGIASLYSPGLSGTSKSTFLAGCKYLIYRIFTPSKTLSCRYREMSRSITKGPWYLVCTANRDFFSAAEFNRLLPIFSQHSRHSVPSVFTRFFHFHSPLL